jgi:membrane fusion protein (multidrug efflux system)
VVEAGDVLVYLDVSVERAELAALRARADLAEAMLARVRNLRLRQAISEDEVDRARADRDVALADMARLDAVIDKKTIRAPFRARVGLADVHPGQYLNEGTILTTLQGVDRGVHVDFAVEQRVAATLSQGDSVSVVAAETADATLVARIVGLDSRIDPVTRNATVRARVDADGRVPRPGASVRVVVPVGEAMAAVAIPASALRRGPAGDHVFVLGQDDAGDTRAHLRSVQVAAQLGDEVVVRSGLTAGETVAATGSFKLREAALVTLAGNLLVAGGR